MATALKAGVNGDGDLLRRDHRGDDGVGAYGVCKPGESGAVAIEPAREVKE